MTMEDYDFLTRSMSEVLSLDSKKNSLEPLVKEKKAHLKVQKTELEELKKASKKDIKKLSNYDPIKSQERIDSFQDEVNKLRKQNSELQTQISDIPEPMDSRNRIDVETWDGYLKARPGAWIFIIGYALFSTYQMEKLGIVATNDNADFFIHNTIFCCGWIPFLYLFGFIETIPARLHNHKLRFDIDEMEVSPEDLGYNLEQNKTQIKKLVPKITAEKNKKKLFDHSQKTINKIASKQITIDELETDLDSTKAELKSAKDEIKSILNSVSHLVPYNEHI